MTPDQFRAAVNVRYWTRKLYSAETYLGSGPYLGSEQPVAVLRRLALRIWQREGGGGTPPVVVAGRGYPNDGGLSSYAERKRIVIARHHRQRIIVIHEMAHVLTPHTKLDHGPAFCRVYARLLVDYGRVNPVEVSDHMTELGVKL